MNITMNTTASNAGFTERGFTILEMTVSVGVGIVLIAGALGLGVETIRFASATEDETIVRHEANRAFRRLSELLREVGWATVDNTTYPMISEAGDQLTFRILEDSDGNGWPFSASTGELEWGATLFDVRVNPKDDTLYVFQGTEPVWTLGRHVDSVAFVSYQQDPTVFFQELQVTITASRVNHRGETVQYTAAGSIHMRN